MYNIYHKTTSVTSEILPMLHQFGEKTEENLPQQTRTV